ncbi:hypothetical protein VTN00DRAFT_2901 [Thermoascus crustaceus]|uniref:uncharacterized protein n=1 Tax=Thermoascus crustaceus TaxID=5088 RepID=UPI0037444AB0
MADTLSIAGSVAGLISLSIEVTKIAKKYVRNVKSAPEEIKDLAVQAEALSDVLAKLRDDAAEDVFQPDSCLFSVFKHCNSQLGRLSGPPVSVITRLFYVKTLIRSYAHMPTSVDI